MFDASAMPGTGVELLEARSHDHLSHDEWSRGNRPLPQGFLEWASGLAGSLVLTVSHRLGRRGGGPRTWSDDVDLYSEGVRQLVQGKGTTMCGDPSDVKSTPRPGCRPLSSQAAGPADRWAGNASSQDGARPSGAPEEREIAPTSPRQPWRSRAVQSRSRQARTRSRRALGSKADLTESRRRLPRPQSTT